jgi:hypothetical protein
MGTFVRTINASTALSLPIAVRMPATVVRVSVEKMPVLGAKLMPIVLRATSVLKGHVLSAGKMQIVQMDRVLMDIVLTGVIRATTRLPMS